MARSAFEKLHVYRLSEQLADEAWRLARSWDNFGKDTIGKQLVRAADSVGANIAEGFGRGSHADNRRFIRIARGSMYETMHWLRRAFARNLMNEDQVGCIKPLLDELAPRLNAYLNSVGTDRKRGVRLQPTTNNPQPTTISD
jgi:four helix bundle protein